MYDGFITATFPYSWLSEQQKNITALERMLFLQATVFSMIKDLLRKLQRIISLQVGNVQHRVLNLFSRRATVKALPLFVWGSFSQISKIDILTFFIHTGNFQLCVKIRTILKHPLFLCRLLAFKVLEETYF